ncbi:MAG: hypothetical protein QXQ29_03740, partial [Candidatus Bathyarchaeia archaeon]
MELGGDKLLRIVYAGLCSRAHFLGCSQYKLIAIGEGRSIFADDEFSLSGFMKADQPSDAYIFIEENLLVIVDTSLDSNTLNHGS